MNRPDTSALGKWVDPSAIDNAAQALRADGATFGGVADNVEPVWYDLTNYFQLFTSQDWRIYQAGSIITDYGNAVAAGTSNMARILEDCATLLRGLDTRRQDLFTRAATARSQLTENPDPELDSDDPIPDDFFEQQALHQSALNNVMRMEDEVSALASEYRSLMQSTASELSGVTDTGGHISPLWGAALDAGLFAAGFYPPTAAVVTLLSAGKTLLGEYQSRSAELKGERPELSDGEVAGNSGWHTVGVSPFVVGLPALAGHGAGRVLSKTDPVAGAGLETGISWAGGATGAKVTDNWVSAGQDPPGRQLNYPHRSSFEQDSFGPPLTPEEALKRETTQGILNDPHRIRETKDYDRDGFTDEPFRPGPPRLVTIPNTDISSMKNPEAPPEKLVLPRHQDPFEAITD